MTFASFLTLGGNGLGIFNFSQILSTVSVSDTDTPLATAIGVSSSFVYALHGLLFTLKSPYTLFLILEHICGLVVLPVMSTMPSFSATETSLGRAILAHFRGPIRTPFSPFLPFFE